MSLRIKTLFVTGLTLAALLVVLTVSLRLILLDSYQQIEYEEAEKNLNRARNALFGTLEQMDRTTQDYSYWDDLYHFMITGDPAFSAANLVESTFSNSRWNLILLINAQGVQTYRAAFDLAEKKYVPIPPSWEDAIKARLTRLTSQTTGEAVKGLLRVPEGILFVVSREILQSNLAGPPHGFMITARLFSAAENRLLADQTLLQMELKTLADNERQDSIMRQRSKENYARSIQRLNDEELIAIEELYDLDQQPVCYIKLFLPRTAFIQGQKSLYYLLTAVVICATIFSGMILVLLERLVLSRMSSLKSQVAAIGASHDLGHRLPAAGKDEIGLLSNSINQMLLGHENLHSLLQIKSQELSEAYLDICNLLRIMTHDQNNYLAIAMANAEVLLQSTDDANLQKCSEKILWAVNAQRDLIQKISRFGAIQTGKSTCEPSAVLLTEALSKTKKTFENQLQSKQITLDIDNQCPPEIKIMVDPTIFVSSILNNLVSNAIKFSPVGSRISMECQSLNNDIVRIAIKDKGIGIPPDLLEGIFSFTKRTTRLGTSGEKGTGFGMPIVKSLVEKMNGTIAVHSSEKTEETKEHGTTFSLTVQKAA